MDALSGLPQAALLGIGSLIILQLTLQVVALVQLVRTPAERVTIGGRKWVWAVIILFGEIVGPLIWFFAGRTAAPVADVAPSAPVSARADDAADALYGKAPQDQQ